MGRIDPCCETMRHQLEHSCPQHGVACPDKVVVYSEQTSRYLLVAPNATYIIYYCPWCGTRIQEDEPDGQD